MKFVRNIPEGACSSIAFFQFVKSCHHLQYKDLYKFMITKIKSEEKYISLISPTIEYYYDKIQNNSISVEQIPNGGKMNKFLKNRCDELKLFGESEFGHISLFCRYLCLLWSGIWVGDLEGENINFMKFDHKASIDYTKFMIEHKIQHIPRICHMVWINDFKIVQPGFHTMIILNNVLYDSNYIEPVLVKEIVPIYCIK